jgi:uncharacterized membrane protein
MEQTYTPYQRRTTMPGANVGSNERMLMLLAGAALLGFAWKRNSKSLGATSVGMLLRGATGYCPAYGALGIDQADTKRALAGERGVHIRESITIGAPAEEIYRFWRQLDRLPDVMPHLASVEQLDTKRSRWTAKAFDAVPVTWEAEIINEQPFELISWQTLPGQAIQTAGSVQFKPAPSGGTNVHVHLQYAAPGGKAANWLAWLAGQDPAKYTREGLGALKRRLEVPPPSSAPGLSASPVH